MTGGYSSLSDISTGSGAGFSMRRKRPSLHGISRVMTSGRLPIAGSLPFFRHWPGRVPGKNGFRSSRSSAMRPMPSLPPFRPDATGSALNQPRNVWRQTSCRPSQRAGRRRSGLHGSGPVFRFRSSPGKPSLFFPDFRTQALKRWWWRVPCTQIRSARSHPLRLHCPSQSSARRGRTRGAGTGF